MRSLLVIALLLTVLLTLWCAAGYYFAPVQQIETRAELQHSRAAGLSDAEIATHVDRVGQEGRNWGFAALGAGAAAGVSLAALILASKRKVDIHST
jgi:hypothetical protein